jgi:hypothetical protein
MCFEKMKRTPRFPNFVLYTDPLPYPTWRSDQELLKNMDYVFEMILKNTFFLDIFYSNSILLQTYLPPSKSLQIIPTKKWSIPIQIQLKLFSLLSDFNNPIFEVDLQDIRKLINTQAQPSSYRLFSNLKVYPLIYLGCSKSDSKTHILTWLNNLHETIWSSLELSINDDSILYITQLKSVFNPRHRNKDPTYCQYEYFLYNMHSFVSWETSAIAYLLSLNPSSSYGSQYMSLSREAIHRQHIFFLLHLPDFLGNLFQIENWQQNFKIDSETSYLDAVDKVLRHSCFMNSNQLGNTWNWLRVRNSFYQKHIDWYTNHDKIYLNILTIDHLHLLLPFTKNIFDNISNENALDMYTANKSSFLMILVDCILDSSKRLQLEIWLQKSLDIKTLHSSHVQNAIDFVSIFLLPFDEYPFQSDLIPTIQKYFPEIQPPNFFSSFFLNKTKFDYKTRNSNTGTSQHESQAS